MRQQADRPPPRRVVLAIAWLCACVLVSPARAVTQLKRQSDAPPVVLRDLGGVEVNTANLRRRTLILIFGELYHDKTRQACALIDAALRDQRLQGQPINPILIVSQTPTPEMLRTQPGEKLPSTILVDPARKAFGAYEVAVMPSVVVVDAEGKVVHAIAGLGGRFADVLTDSLLLATGKLSAEKFQQSLHPEPSAVSEDTVRAGRVAMLARQLAARGMNQMAVEKYEEALKLDPTQVGAQLELGALMLKARRLAEAEKWFRAVLARDAASAEAALGLATVQVLRGGTEVDEAERSLRGVLGRDPSNARAHYLLGLVYEKRGRIEDAAASFKKSAQLLLEQPPSEEEP